jgi:eukaryotic-like serine/threonine-protein kinase
VTDSLAQLADALAERYRIDRKVGQGGMATVYLAEDLRHQRQVAIKVLRPDVADIVGGERFLQESRLTANLHQLLGELRWLRIRPRQAMSGNPSAMG